MQAQARAARPPSLCFFTSHRNVCADGRDGHLLDPVLWSRQVTRFQACWFKQSLISSATLSLGKACARPSAKCTKVDTQHTGKQTTLKATCSKWITQSVRRLCCMLCRLSKAFSSAAGSQHMLRQTPAVGSGCECAMSVSEALVTPSDSPVSHQ